VSAVARRLGKSRQRVHQLIDELGIEPEILMLDGRVVAFSLSDEDVRVLEARKTARGPAPQKKMRSRSKDA
jgi:hypothetical protein